MIRAQELKSFPLEMTLMPRSRMTSVSRLTLLLGVVALAASTSSQASPNGRSVRRAAQLKKSAPGWLSHYLPDDRYKIEGKVWKYVSTDLDTYYHRPDSPNMLRQSADRVIGFASAREAEEAGYKPDPSDGTASMAAPAPAMSGTSAVGATSRGGKITLSDGVSTIVLPAGWRRMSFPSRSTNGMTFSYDILMNPQTKQTAFVGAIKRPGMNFTQELRPEKVQTTLNSLGGLSATGGRISTGSSQQLANWAATANPRPTSWGGLRGVSIKPPATAKATDGNLVMVGRGDKAYLYSIVKQPGQGDTATRSMLSTFRPR
jgi:hypothetical protein